MIGLVMDKGIFITISDELANAKFSDENLVLTNLKPYHLIKDAFWNRVKNRYLFDNSIFQANKHNFRIELSEITAFDYVIIDAEYQKIPLHGLLFLSTHLSDIKLDKPQSKSLYSQAAKYSRNNTNPLRKKLFVIQNQATNFDATYTAVRNWLLEQNLLNK
jgi:hypothetical protein